MLSKLFIKNFSLFKNNYNKLCCKNCRAFHAASYDIFYFSSDRAFSWWNDGITKSGFVIHQKSYLFRIIEVWSPKFYPVWKQKIQLRNKWSCANCRAFHAALYDIFYLLISCIEESKTAMQTYNEHEWWRNKSYRKLITIILCEVWSNNIRR